MPYFHRVGWTPKNQNKEYEQLHLDEIQKEHHSNLIPWFCFVKCPVSR